MVKKQSPNFIKKETLAQVVSCEFCEISKNTFSHRKTSVAASDSCSVSKCFRNKQIFSKICPNIYLNDLTKNK